MDQNFNFFKERYLGRISNRNRYLKEYQHEDCL